MAEAIVKATTHYQDASIVAEVSKNLGNAMPGISSQEIPEANQFAVRGW